MCPPGYLRFVYDISGYIQKDDKRSDVNYDRRRTI